MALTDTVRHFLGIVSWANIRKGVSFVRSGNLAVLRSAVKNLMDQRAALDQPFSKRQQDLVIRFEPTPHDDAEPLVSIVIPCYNYGAYVEEAVRSALNQTYRNIEVLVVDGGSTDGVTREVVASLAGHRVRVFLRDGRHLAGANRNFGIENARSPYIVCLDADDTLAPTFVEKALFLAEHCGFDVVSPGLNLFGARTGKVGIMLAPTLRDMLAGNHVYTCALFRKTSWAAVGGFHDYGLGQDHAAEDWDFWIRLSASGVRICNISGEHLLNYRTHAGGSLSSDHSVPDITQQRQRILSQLGDVASPSAVRNSVEVSARIQIVRHSQTQLTKAMLADPPRKGQPSILIVMPFFLIGGAERLLVRVVEELQRAGWRVVLVSTVAQPVDETDAITWFEKLTPEVYALPRFARPIYWHAFIDYLLSSREFSGILVAGSPLLYDLIPTIRYAKPDMKFVDFLFNTEGHTEPHARLRQYFNGVLCENEEVRSWCLKQGWSDDKIAVIESKISVADYHPEMRPVELAKALGISPDDVVVGWSGRLSEEKSPETFLKAARICAGLPNVVFVMTGSGRLAKQVAAAVERLPTGSRFHFCGTVDDVKPYFELYDICIIPSLIDGRPIAALEASASGCVLIASNVGGLPRLVRDGETGFLSPPGDARFIAETIRMLSADRSRLAAMKRAARRFAEDRLDRRDADLPYHDALNRLMSPKH